MQTPEKREPDLPKKILLVDDEPSIRESLSKILRGEDYEVVIAENGGDAIEKHSADRIDLLILDLTQPLANGWEALLWLAEVNPFSPLIIITRHTDQRAVAEAAGADVLMQKPLDVPLLLKSIRELLDQPPERRAQRASSHAASFRYVPSTTSLSRETLFKRSNLPDTAPGLPIDEES